MVTLRRITPALLLLTACGGGRAVAQPQDDGLARLHVYEVSPEQAAQTIERGFIEVSGTGTVSIEADRAHVSFTVETRAVGAADAAAANAELMTAVLDAIRGGGFSGLEVETFGYSLSPQYARLREGQTPEISGYAAMNNVRATIDDVQQVGGLLDVAIAAGANRVSGLTFGASDTGAARRTALTQAVENARAEAEVIATALGRRLGDPLEVRGGAQMPSPLQRSYDMALRAVEVTPIEPGDQIVTAHVTVRFAIGAAR